MVLNKVGELKGTITASASLVGTIEQSNSLTGIIDVSPTNICYGQLKAVMSSPMTLVGRISGINTLKGILTIPPITETINSYEGDYTITPKIDSQTMKTKNKKMEDNVTVLAIPYFETSNLTGKTVYIGGE